MTIDVRHVTRVEGHGNIGVRVRDGTVTDLQLSIVESPRFFESFLRGRTWREAPHITCRICGICSVAHTTASIKAVEAACDLIVSRQTLLLRQLILNAEHLQSHVLHLYFLAVPDYLGVGSVIPLARTHPEIVHRALRMKKLANDLCAAIAGRHVHPISMHVGGFTHVPAAGELADLGKRLVAAREDVAESIALYKSLIVPNFDRPTEYVSLRDRGGREYAPYDGDIVSTLDPTPTDPKDYRRRVQETVVEHSTAKHVRSPNAPTYAVGALARFLHNHSRLHPAALSAAFDLGLSAECRNPFHNNTAQLVEVVHGVERSIELIDELLTLGPRLEPLVAPTHFGPGVGAVEAPRGLLFHDYTIDQEGRLTDVNLVIPTGQNLANLEEDMRAYVPVMLAAGLSREEMTLRLEMLVRAYDPCISCATHFLEVDWA